MKFNLPKWASPETTALHEAFEAKADEAEEVRLADARESKRLKEADVTTIKLPAPEVRMQSKLRAVTVEIAAREAATGVWRRLIDVDALAECSRLTAAFLAKRTELAAKLLELGFTDYDPKFKGRAGLDVLFRNSHVREIATEEGRVRAAMEAFRRDADKNQSRLAELRTQRDKLTADIRELLVA